MRARCMVAALTLMAATAGAAPLLGGAEYLELLEKSKLKYKVSDEVPDDPDPDMTCGPRQDTQRVVESADGSITLVSWLPSKEAEPHFTAAEKHYSTKDMDSAEQEYQKGLAIDPDYGPGWLYSGDIPYHKGDYETALSRYRRALALDRTLATGHRFAADALLHLGRDEEAENELVLAVLYNPAYEGALDRLEQLSTRRGFRLVRETFPLKAELGKRKGRVVPVRVSPGAGTGALGYTICRAAWRHEQAFRKEQLGSGAKDEYTLTTQEERACALAYLEGEWAEAESKLTEKAKAAGAPAPTMDDIRAAASELSRHLEEIAAAGMLDAYVRHVIIGQRCPGMVVLIPTDLRQDTERFIRKFMVVHEPAVPTEAKPAAP